MTTGQEHILNYLKKSVENNRISHAYLFEGAEHLGKKTVALWFAKILECQGESIEKPCNKCRSCQDIEKNRHPDVKIISVTDGKKEISIEQIRELRRYLSLFPHSSSYKIAIIDSAETMDDEAANALLKTLEEPRGNAVLILIASIVSALPETILSRCEEIKFRTSSLDKISKDLIKKEYIDILQRSLNDIFKYIEKIPKESPEALNLLDSWLFWFRDLLVKNKKTKYSQGQLVEIIRKIQKTKDLISNTNINQRLALENLVLEINV